MKVKTSGGLSSNKSRIHTVRLFGQFLPKRAARDTGATALQATHDPGISREYMEIESLAFQDRGRKWKSLPITEKKHRNRGSHTKESILDNDSLGMTFEPPSDVPSTFDLQRINEYADSLPNVYWIPSAHEFWTSDEIARLIRAEREDVPPGRQRKLVHLFPGKSSIDIKNKWAKLKKKVPHPLDKQVSVDDIVEIYMRNGPTRWTSSDIARIIATRMLYPALSFTDTKWEDMFPTRAIHSVQKKWRQLQRDHPELRRGYGDMVSKAAIPARKATKRCLPCWTAQVVCDGKQPCERCTIRERDCVAREPKRGRAGQPPGEKCLPCLNHVSRCDRERPCGFCTKNRRVCDYPHADARDAMSREPQGAGVETCTMGTQIQKSKRKHDTEETVPPPSIKRPRLQSSSQ
jgi:hypothetical protein